VSDVMSGAGIGILSAELGYAFADLIFKGKGLNRNDLAVYPDLRHNPSFFSVGMGVGFGNRNLNFGDDYKFKFRNSTVINAEAAYFFNPYIGVGGNLRIKTTPIGNFTEFAQSDQAEWNEGISELASEEYAGMENFIKYVDLEIESDHLTEFTASVGPYVSYPFADRWAVGAKALLGYSFMNALEVDGIFSGENLFEDKDYYWQGDYLMIDADNAFSFTTGISLTYAYRQNFSWKLYCDYDYSRKTYTMTYDPWSWFLEATDQETYNEFKNDGDIHDKVERSIKKKMNSWLLGVAFTISF